MNIKTSNSTLLYVALLLTFGGYYSILILQANYNLPLSLTILVRIAILFILTIFFLTQNKIPESLTFKLIIFFLMMYFFRILYMQGFGSGEYAEYLFYFLAFSALPFILISCSRLGLGDIDSIVLYIQISFLIFFSLIVFYYGDYIFSGMRLSAYVSKDENYISPLSLSYCASMAMGLSIIYFMFSPTKSYKLNVLMLLVFILSIPAFILGASRGAIISLIIAFILIVMFQSSTKIRLYISIFLVSFFLLMVFISSNYNISAVDRFLSLGDDISSGSSSAIRLNIWALAFGQFIDNPLFGNDIIVTEYGGYAHNVFIGSLISTGILGGSLFLISYILMLFQLRRLSKISFKANYLIIIFIQSSIQVMFSGAIYTAAWFFASAALVIALSSTHKRSFVSESLPVCSA
ncbi:O-antigen ligase family protein [Pseudoalteromonas sp. S983]|uniref:O-antigen ligase family protein n=1 Tax=Pseudoalteromonas sp. S983 TaxID=579572 RepID=UPI00110A86E9|nr:O-antigen ligase family protein [Pseudoalteromonas sp. S983]TMP79134.1 hypothetical protein CWB71_16415 [Pseudoalteromonas sp. S983]